MPDDLFFDLSVRFPDFFLEATATIPANGITVLSGPSGSGKTTLLRALAGLEPGAEGTIRLGAEDWSNRTPAARGVGYVFQDARLFPHLDVAGNLAYGARRRGTSPDQQLAIIAALDLKELLTRFPAKLSGGEARRVALGRALSSGPKVLLMDEPLAGLDRARKATLMPYIARAVGLFGGPALYVTHSDHETSILADRELSIERGRLTGWRGGSPRLNARIVAASDAKIQLEVGAQKFWVVGQGRIGNWVELPLGSNFLVSSHDPGQSSAELTLSGNLVAQDGVGLTIKVEDQDLCIPNGKHNAANWALGQPVWLSLAHPLGPVLARKTEECDSD